MQIILLGMLMFNIVILSLVVILMVARSKLVSTGEVNIEINEDTGKTLNVPAGASLLSTLASQQIFLPSACGGKGTCGVCKVKVLEGGGAMLPTESGHISRGEAREGIRLSCQVKVKNDLKIEVPPEIFNIRKWQCTVRSNRNVATFIKELVLELPEARKCRSGPAATSRSSARPIPFITRILRSRNGSATTGTSTASGIWSPAAMKR